MLSSFFTTQTVDAIAGALDSADALGGTIAVVGDPRLGRSLAERGLAVLIVSEKSKSLRRVGGRRLYADPAALPLGDGALAAVVGFGLGQRADWSPVMTEWTRVLADGGAMVLVDRAPPAEMTRRALCGGLAEIEQRQAGRTFVTSGLVTKL